MKTFMLLSGLLLAGVSVSAYQWDSIGPTNVQVYNFNTAYCGGNVVQVLCTNEGIIISENGNWNSYVTYDFPAWGAVGLDDNTLLLILGAGSYSDGIYTFNLTTHEVEVVEWMINPEFICFCNADDHYYAGGETGMVKSADGITFTSVEFFNMKKCESFVWYDNHYVVGATGGVYISPDYGNTWTPSTSTLLPPYSLAFDGNGKVYAIAPDEDLSTVFCHSNDFGDHWFVDVSSDSLSSVIIDADNNVFIGSYDLGVHRWDPDMNLLVPYNDWIPDLHVNNLGINPLVNCLNIVACTNHGAHILTEYIVGIDENTTDISTFDLKSFPNPFSQSAVISYDLKKAGKIKIQILNSSGKIIKTLIDQFQSEGRHSVVWDGTDQSENPVDNGVYFYTLSTDDPGIPARTNKMLLLK